MNFKILTILFGSTTQFLIISTLLLNLNKNISLNVIKTTLKYLIMFFNKENQMLRKSDKFNNFKRWLILSFLTFVYSPLLNNVYSEPEILRINKNFLFYSHMGTRCNSESVAGKTSNNKIRWPQFVSDAACMWVMLFHSILSLSYKRIDVLNTSW